MKGRTIALALAISSLAGAAQVRIHVAIPGVRVRTSPPAVRIEAPSLAPSPGHHWIPGHWAWRGRNHVWIGGQWLLPPRPGLVWSPVRWVREGRRWTYYEGYWQDNGFVEAAQIYEPSAEVSEEADVEPPPPLVEVRPAIPFVGAVWISGSWHWNSHRHVWIAGRWSAPKPGHAWVPGHWTKGPKGRWHHAPGHWRG
jgi:hypothetical protein